MRVTNFDHEISMTDLAAPKVLGGMAESDTDDFVAFLLERAGQAVRSVARYDAESTEILFIRDDVAEHYEPTSIETVLANLREEGEQAARQEHLYAHGELNSIVRCFDGGIEMHFPYGESEGLAVTLEPAAAESLYEFVDNCLDHLVATETNS